MKSQTEHTQPNETLHFNANDRSGRDSLFTRLFPTKSVTIPFRVEAAPAFRRLDKKIHRSFLSYNERPPSRGGVSLLKGCFPPHLHKTTLG